MKVMIANTEIVLIPKDGKNIAKSKTWQQNMKKIDHSPMPVGWKLGEKLSLKWPET